MAARRTLAGWMLSIAGLCLAFWLVGRFASGEAGFDWGAATSAAAAYGTLALALVTWRLVALTRADASGTLQLARLAEREQEARERTLRRERLERVLDAVNQLVDAAIIAREVPSQAQTAVPVAKARLRTAIAVSGVPIEKLGSTELLLRDVDLEAIERQAETATTHEIPALLAEIDSQESAGASS